jgi:predicted PurR-regulated permease PerM
MAKVMYLYLILFLSCATSHVVNAQVTRLSQEPSQVTTISPALGISQEENTNQKNLQSESILLLNSLVNDQKQQITQMHEKIDKLEDSSGLNFAVWSGIALTSVAVILTALGIVMAIFSFFGYKKMINGAKEAATRISTEKATEVTEGLAPGITETVLLKMLHEGKFDDLIFDGIEKVAYRGIEFSGGDMLEDNTEERAE